MGDPEDESVQDKNDKKRNFLSKVKIGGSGACLRCIKEGLGLKLYYIDKDPPSPEAVVLPAEQKWDTALPVPANKNGDENIIVYVFRQQMQNKNKRNTCLRELLVPELQIQVSGLLIDRGDLRQFIVSFKLLLPHKNLYPISNNHFIPFQSIDLKYQCVDMPYCNQYF